MTDTVPQCCIDHECPACGRIVRGPGFFVHASKCTGTGQTDMGAVWEYKDYHSVFFQKWRIEKRAFGSEYMVPIEPFIAKFENKCIDTPAPLTGGV